MERKAIVTIPPYAPYIGELARHPVVKGFRLNTVMPLKESKFDVLKRLDEIAQDNKIDLWIDLKGRQLRTTSYANPPYTDIKLSHEIETFTPCRVYFSDRNEYSTILEVDKNRLIMQEGPKRIIGPGESVTIIHPTLKIKGYLTDCDKEYIEAGEKAGINKFMLSFYEGAEDLEELRKYNTNAEAIGKIESEKGLDYVFNKWNGEVRLMAARGDLYMELEKPHRITEVVENILKKDKNAIVASRILSSLSLNAEPSCEDIGDLDNLLRMGYKTAMFGDDVCFKRDSIVSALNVFYLMAKRYKDGGKDESK